MLHIYLLSAFLIVDGTAFTMTSIRLRNTTMQNRLEQLMAVTGPLEWVDTIIDDFCELYPELRPPNEESIIALKLELNYFFTAPRDEQDSVIRGNSSTFRMVSDKITHLRRIARIEMASLNGSWKGKFEDEDHFILSRVYSSMFRLHQRRSANYFERGLSADLIRKEIDEKQVELWKLWHGHRSPDKSKNIPNEEEILKDEL